MRVVAPHTTATVLITPFMADTDPPISDLVIVPAPDVDVRLDHDADLAISSLRPPLHRHQMVVADLVIRIQGTPEAMRARFGDRPVADLEALAGETVITPRTGVHGRVVQAAAGLDFPLSVRSAATGVVAQGLAANEHGFAAVTEQPDFGLTGLPLVVGGEPVVSPLHASWDVQHYAAPEVHRLARDFAHWMSVTPPWAPA